MTRTTAPVHELQLRQFDLGLLSIRPVEGDDGKLLGSLLYCAYQGTVDDEGQTLEESWTEGIEILQGKYGLPIWPACFFAIGEEGNAVSCTIVTDEERHGPLLAFAATDPSYQKRGLAGRLISMSLDALRAVDVEKVALVVTDENRSAISLYKRLGFVALELS